MSTTATDQSVVAVKAFPPAYRDSDSHLLHDVYEVLVSLFDEVPGRFKVRFGWLVLFCFGIVRGQNSCAVSLSTTVFIHMFFIEPGYVSRLGCILCRRGKSVDIDNIQESASIVF